MLISGTAMRNAVIGVVGLASLSCVAWFVYIVKTAGNEPTSRTPQERGQPTSYSANDDQVAILPDFDQVESFVEQTKEVDSDAGTSDSAQCSVRCSSTLSMLDKDLELNDETFNRLETHITEIAAYLQDDEGKRQEYLEMALSTEDGDKRSFLTDVFKRLPYEQKAEIGNHFVGSENWRVRTNGIALIADEDISSLAVSDRLIDIYSTEQNLHVKGTILASLKQSSILQGDTGILQQLDSVLYNEAEPQVRIAALKAKMELSEHPFDIIPDAVQALRTTEPEFQLAGLIAIDQILADENKHIENGAYIDKASIKSDIESIRDLSSYKGDRKRFDRLIREANAIYLRHF